VPRLSLWKDGVHSNDYRFLDRRISEMFTIGGTGILVHKYLGPESNPKAPADVTQPKYSNLSEKNIQDLLFLENRDRIYDTSVYPMRGIYQVSDSDFDLTQFGLFLATGTLFLTFHITDMVNILGRRLMNGDVIELMHLKDYEALTDVPTALKRFFIIGDCQRASEGFTATWWPHLWRCKINPLIDSQEYKDIIAHINKDVNGNPVTNILSTYDSYLNINQAIVDQAEKDVPFSGYDTSGIYVMPLDNDGEVPSLRKLTADRSSNIIDASDAGNALADSAAISPNAKVQGYLTGDGIAPNGFPCATGIAFPSAPDEGDYCLRVDYSPNRLFRFNGKYWVKIEDAVRNNLTPGPQNASLKSGFINYSGTYKNSDGVVDSSRQNLSTVLKPKADNK
jgi:hypothetical protein